MRTGQCFIIHNDNSSIKGYFFTGLYDKGHLVMCEMVSRPEQLNQESFLLMDEELFDKEVEDGRIELI